MTRAITNRDERRVKRGVDRRKRGVVRWRGEEEEGD